MFSISDPSFCIVLFDIHESTLPLPALYAASATPILPYLPIKFDIYFVPMLIFTFGSIIIYSSIVIFNSFATSCAVGYINCISPFAPLCDSAFVSKLLSAFITA